MRYVLVLLALVAAAPATAAERAGHPIGADVIAAAITREIAARRPLGDASFELDNPALRIYAASADEADLEIDRLTFEPRGGRVTAYVVAEDGPPVRVTGRLRQMIELPVLIRPVSPGDAIAAGDVGRITVAADRFLQGYVADADDLIGKTPRRPLRANEPLRPGDLRVPVVVKRGDIVTIVLQTPSLQLTTHGKAAEDGGQGATIRVANEKSGRVVEAVVTGPNTVAILPPRAAATR